MMCACSLVSTLSPVPKAFSLQWPLAGGIGEVFYLAFFCLSHLAFTCNPTSPPVLAPEHQEGRAGSHCREFWKFLLAPSSPSLSHQCPPVCISSPWGIAMPFSCSPGCAQISQRGEMKCQALTQGWSLSPTDKPQAIPNESQWHV